MDFVEVIRLYIKEMVAMAGPGMKVMLMDRETTSIVSCAYAQSEMMQREVYLFERLDAPNAFEREPIGYLKCIALLRPTPDNVQRLATELRRPKYAQYYIFWTNIISKTDVKTLAEADEQETVREMHEIFVDTIPLAPHFAVAPGVSSDSCFEASVQLAPSALRRAKETLVSALLALNRSPLIRYEKTAAGDAQRLAEDVAQVIRREDGLFENAKSGQTVVLILERAHDPVTPLLNQWTYEAMVHELLGITNNRVTLDDQSIVLSAQHDHFYAQNQFSNFGEIGTAIKQLMADFQQKAHVSKQIESVADMKQFVDEYPQFKKMSGTVTKHVALMSELSRQVARQNLLELSELEQSIVADGEHARCLERIRALIEHEKTTEQNALRLVMLYALRFEHYANNDLRGLVDLLKRRGNARAHALVASLLRYAGAQRRSNDLFGQASVGQFTKRLIKGLKGVENIYTQHQPFLEQVLEQFCRGRLADAAFPWVSTSESSAVNPSRVDQVVVFMIGGATFEESAAVRAHNARRATAAAGVLIPSALLVSTHTLNTETLSLRCSRDDVRTQIHATTRSHPAEHGSPQLKRDPKTTLPSPRDHLQHFLCLDRATCDTFYAVPLFRVIHYTHAPLGGIRRANRDRTRKDEAIFPSACPVPLLHAIDCRRCIVIIAISTDRAGITGLHYAQIILRRICAAEH